MAHTKAQQSLLNKTRKDKFILVCPVPDALKNIASKTTRLTHEKSHMRVLPDKLQYSIYGAVVPAVEIPAIEVPKYGQTLRISSHTRSAYAPVNVNFTVDNSFNNYWYIWRWLEVLNDAKYSEYDYYGVGTSRKSEVIEGMHGTTKAVDTSSSIGTASEGPELLLDYATDFTLYAIDEYNDKTAEFIFTYAFPTTLGELSYNYRDTAEMECSFTFSFTQLQLKLM